MRTKNLFGMLLLFLCTISLTSCNDDDDLKDPDTTITLNMMNEKNGKTIIGESDVYINNSNNFKTSSCYLTDVGETSGIGFNIQPQLNNLTQEAAVIPGHLYQIFHRNVMRNFPSGNRAILIGTGYYKVYVVSPINNGNENTGATVKYVLEYPATKGLPENEKIIGKVDNIGDQVEFSLPKDAEYAFSDYLNNERNSFDIRTENGKLKITLLESIDKIHGPYGHYGIYIRSGAVYTEVILNAGAK